MADCAEPEDEVMSEPTDPEDDWLVGNTKFYHTPSIGRKSFDEDTNVIENWPSPPKPAASLPFHPRSTSRFNMARNTPATTVNTNTSTSANTSTNFNTSNSSIEHSFASYNSPYTTSAGEYTTYNGNYNHMNTYNFSSNYSGSATYNGNYNSTTHTNSINNQNNNLYAKSGGPRMPTQLSHNSSTASSLASAHANNPDDIDAAETHSLHDHDITEDKYSGYCAQAGVTPNAPRRFSDEDTGDVRAASTMPADPPGIDASRNKQLTNKNSNNNSKNGSNSNSNSNSNSKNGNSSSTNGNNSSKNGINSSNSKSGSKKNGYSSDSYRSDNNARNTTSDESFSPEITKPKTTPHSTFSSFRVNDTATRAQQQQQPQQQPPPQQPPPPQQQPPPPPQQQEPQQQHSSLASYTITQADDSFDPSTNSENRNTITAPEIQSFQSEHFLLSAAQLAGVSRKRSMVADDPLVDSENSQLEGNLGNVGRRRRKNLRDGIWEDDQGDSTQNGCADVFRAHQMAELAFLRELENEVDAGTSFKRFPIPEAFGGMQPSVLSETVLAGMSEENAAKTMRNYIKQLGMFVPGILIKYYIDRALENTLTDTVRHEMFAKPIDAAVLFVDISGFSQLAEDLQKHHSVTLASKTLAREVGEALGPLIKIVLEWGGDVIKFAGDATFAIFPTSAHKNMENAVAAACLAARKMVRFSLSNATSGVQLKVHCGIGAGKVVGFHVGGVLNRWEYAITGDPLNQVTAAEKVANAGQVVMSTEAHSQIREFCESEIVTAPGNKTEFHLVKFMYGEDLGATVVRAKRFWEELDRMGSVQLSRIYLHMMPYVPRPVIQAMKEDRSGDTFAFLAEVRMCVTLFIKLTNIQFNDESDIGEVHKILRLVQKKLYGFNGATLCRLIVDDKGLTNLWAFGMPPHDMNGSDNFAFFAVFAALELHVALQEFGCSCSVGITAGRVFCGTVGGSQRCEYTLHGTQVNLAARLMVKAGQGVLCDEIVHGMTREMIVYDPPFKTEVKGKVGEIDVYRPRWAKPEFLKLIPEPNRLDLVIRSSDAEPHESHHGPSLHLNTDALKLQSMPSPSSSPAATPSPISSTQHTPNSSISLRVGRAIAITNLNHVPTVPPVVTADMANTPTNRSNTPTLTPTPTPTPALSSATSNTSAASGTTNSSNNHRPLYRGTANEYRTNTRPGPSPLGLMSKASISSLNSATNLPSGRRVSDPTPQPDSAPVFTTLTKYEGWGSTTKEHNRTRITRPVTTVATTTTTPPLPKPKQRRGDSVSSLSYKKASTRFASSTADLLNKLNPANVTTKYCTQCQQPNPITRSKCKHCDSESFTHHIGGEIVKRCAACNRGTTNKKLLRCEQCGFRRFVEERAKT